MGNETRRVRMTNNTNRDIAQMNNEYNERQFNKQIEYNWQMWNATNAYNTPSAQAQRYKDAGISPYAMVNNGSAGNAAVGQSVSPPTASSWQAQTSEFSPFEEMLNQLVKIWGTASSAQDSFNTAADTAMKNAQVEQIHIDNQTRHMQNVATLQKLMSDKGISDQTKANMKQAFDFNEVDNPVKLEQDKQTLEFTRQQIISTQLQNGLYAKNLQYFDEEKRAEIDEKLANIAKLYADKKLTEAQVSEVVQNTLESEARSAGIKLNNDIVRDTKDVVVKSAKLDYANDKTKFWINRNELRNLEDYGTREASSLNGTLDIETPFGLGKFHAEKRRKRKR